MERELVIVIGKIIGPSYWDCDTWDYVLGTTTEDIQMQFEWFEWLNGERPTSVRLDIGSCYGGDVAEALDIYSYLRSLGLPISCHIRVQACSAATLLMCAADAGQLTAEEFALVMVHKPLFAQTFGNAAALRADADLLDKVEAGMLAVYVARFGGTTEEWAARLLGQGNEGNWYTAAEARALSMLDAVVPLTSAAPAELATPQARLDRAKAAVASLRFPAPTAKPADAQTSPAVPNAATPAKPSPTKPTPGKPVARPNVPAKPIAKPTAKTSFWDRFRAFMNGEEAAASGAEPAVKAVEQVEAADDLTVTAASVELSDSGGTLYFDGELAVDSTVYTDEEMTATAEAGDYALNDGRTLTVDADGVVTAITEAEATADLSDEKPADANLRRQIAALEREKAALAKKLRAANAKVLGKADVTADTNLTDDKPGKGDKGAVNDKLRTRRVGVR